MKAVIENGIVSSPYKPWKVPHTSLYTYYKAHLEKFGERTALIENGVSTTYAQLLKLFQRYAAGFQANGISQGDRVCVQLGSSVENFLAAWGLIFAGGTLLLLGPGATPGEIVQYMKFCGATKLLFDTSYAPVAEQVQDLTAVEATYVIGGQHPEFLSVSSFRDLDETLFVDPPHPEGTNGALASLNYTSGSTGEPKLVEITESRYVEAHSALTACKMVDPDDVGIIFSTVAHIFDLYLPYLFWGVGATVVFMGKSCVTAQEFADAISTHQVTNIIGFSAELKQMSTNLMDAGIRLSSVNKLSIAGSKTPKVFLDKFKTIFNLRNIKNCCGITEIGIVLCSTGEDLLDTSVGFPVPHVRVKVVDVTSGKVLGPNEKGELLYSSPGAMRGYYGRPDATKAIFDEDRWMRSGDIGYYDERGRFYLVDRLKDIIKYSDYTFAPSELEEILLSHDQVKEAAVVSVPRGDVGDVTTAFVVLKSCSPVKTPVTPDELVRLVAGQTAEFKHLHGGVVFVDSFPRAQNGKVLKNKLRSNYMAGSYDAAT